VHALIPPKFGRLTKALGCKPKTIFAGTVEKTGKNSFVRISFYQ